MLYLHLFNLAASCQDTMDFSLQAGLSKDIQRSVSSRQSSDRSCSLETWGVFRLWVVSQAGLPHPSSLPSSALAPVPPLSASWGKRKGFPAVTRMSQSLRLNALASQWSWSCGNVYSVQTKEIDMETLFFSTSFLLCVISLKLPAPTQIISCQLTYIYWKTRSTENVEFQNY